MGGTVTVDPGTVRMLEWPKIQARLAARTSWSRSRAAALALMPSSDPQEVESRLQETAEALTWLRLSLALPLGGASDISPLLGRVRRGASLQPEELIAVADAARACRRCRQFMEERREQAPALAGVAQALSDLRQLEEAIERAIDREVGIRDTASAKLSQLRAQIRRQEARIRQHLDSLIASGASFLQEALVTIRDGRFVVPVKAEQRSQVPGIVHDQSGSGATLFVEPLAVVEMNNDLRQLRSQAREEEERILAELSQMVRAQADRLEVGLEALAVLDLAQAKGLLALDMQAVAPQIETGAEGRLEVEGARHPLLTGDVVPIDLVLGDRYFGLVITGPNTGGKTVTLKTAGLLVLMVQAGLYPPARVARLSVFSRVFADIGDEQSIEQNLSTFSAHLRVIRQIVSEADDKSLVLLDELGAGTDPVEGAALAQAILEQLLDRSCRVIATTHLGALKEFAYVHPRAQNASVTFDEKTLQPTYHLVLGVPGSSNALSIAHRLGLPESITQRASELLGHEQVHLEDVVRGLSAERQQAAAERQRWQAAREELAALRQQYVQELEQVQQLRRELQQKATRQVESAVSRALAELDQLVGQARHQVEQERQRLRQEAQRCPAQGESAPGAAAAWENVVHQVDQVRELVRSWRGEGGKRQVEAYAPVLQKARQQLDQAPRLMPGGDVTVAEAAVGAGGDTGEDAAGQPWPPPAGTRVRLRGSGVEAVVRSEPAADGRVEVQAGVMRLRLPLEEIQPWPATKAASAGGQGGSRPMVSAATPARAGTGLGVASPVGHDVPLQLDLRGVRAEEAIERLDKYLDQAVLADLPWVRIIHGKGTGALRAVVTERLSQDRRVQRFRLGEPQEGGSGVTVAWLQ